MTSVDTRDAGGRPQTGRRAASCRTCGDRILFLPMGLGGLRAFDAAEFDIGEVAPGDRYAVLRGRGVVAFGDLARPPGRCFRLHYCAPARRMEPVAGPRNQLLDRRTGRLAEDLERLRSHARRMQFRATNPPHVEPRVPLLPTRAGDAVIAYGQLGGKQCLLCKRTVLGERDLLVAHTDQDMNLHVCARECRLSSPRGNLGPQARPVIDGLARF